jgi:soluble lytic murein transglycosylase-like protein
MDGFGARSMALLAVAWVMAVAAPAGADVFKRTAPDGTRYYTNIQPTPSVRRTSYTPLAATPAIGRWSERPRLVDQEMYAREIAEASARYAVPDRLVWAVIRAESGFDHRAVSRKGARGLMQLMPETAAILGVRDPFDPRQNIHGGVRHLRALMERFSYDLRLAVAAYNAGEKAVVTFGGVPPYPETREYVTRVMRFYGAPIEWGQQPGSSVHRLVEPDGTILYTNSPVRRVSALPQSR